MTEPVRQLELGSSFHLPAGVTDVTIALHVNFPEVSNTDRDYELSPTIVLNTGHATGLSQGVALRDVICKTKPQSGPAPSDVAAMLERANAVYAGTLTQAVIIRSKNDRRWEVRSLRGKYEHIWFRLGDLNDNVVSVDIWVTLHECRPRGLKFSDALAGSTCTLSKGVNGQDDGELAQFDVFTNPEPTSRSILVASLWRQGPERLWRFKRVEKDDPLDSADLVSQRYTYSDQRHIWTDDRWEVEEPEPL